MATAILWWRQLYSELGLSGVGTTQGRLGDVAKQRHSSLINLLFALLRELDTELFLEIGAHEAGASKHFVWQNAQGRSVAYEPAPAVFRRTVESGIPERMEIHECAIGSFNGEIKFFQPTDAQNQPMGSTRRRLGHVGGVPMEVTEVTASIVTLEEAARRAAPPDGRRTALWIDVEGQALEVLSGGQAFLRDRVAAVYIEVQDFNSYEGSATSLEVLQLLLTLGFIPVARDNQHSDAFNLLAVHETAYLQARETIAFWHRANCGATTISNWLIDGKFGEPTL